MTSVDFLDWPVDIWADILSRVQSRPYSFEYMVLSSTNMSTMPEEMRRNSLLELRLTCHKFKEICDKHPAIMRRFNFLQRLDQPAASLFVHKLLAWLKAGRDFTSLTCFSKQPCLGVLIPQLLAAPTQLRHISMSAVNAAHISCLSAYTSLTVCQLHASQHQVLQEFKLQPLAALKSLEDLVLYSGRFVDLPLSDKLTGLFIRNAAVFCNADCTSTNVLRNLSVVSSSCIQLPGIGIGACSALTRLELQQSEIAAYSEDGWYDQREDDWYMQGPCPPESVSNLLSLSNLSVGVHPGVVAMECFSLFPVLNRLHLLHYHTDSLVGDVAGLGKLQSLIVTPVRSHGIGAPLNSATVLAFHFDWAKLKGLKCVQITGGVKFDSSVLQLAKLPDLTQFRLLSFKPGNAQTAEYVAAMASLFATQRPDVDVMIEEANDLPDHTSVLSDDTGVSESSLDA